MQPKPQKAQRKPKPEKAQTILVIGSDRRWDGPQPRNSDTMLLVRILPGEHSISVLSLPRDLLVEIADGRDRLNAAFRLGGERLLIATVRELTGVTIDHFVEVSLRGFGDVVTALGGVYLSVDQRYYNKHDGTAATNYSEIDLQPGYQKLQRADALAFVRYRHGDSDFVRAARQQLFLREALRQTVAAQCPLLPAARHPARLRARHGVRHRLHRRGLEARVGPAVDAAPADPPCDGAGDGRRARRGGLRGGRARLAAPGAAPLVRRQPPKRVRRARPAAPRPRARRPPAAAPVALDDDGGVGRGLVAPLAEGMRGCVPTKLPSGYRWPSHDAARRYPLAGHPAIAAYATAGSGTSVLWMETTWQSPPVLDAPAAVVRRGGRSYDVYTESGGKVRQIAWREGPTRVWITNTLRDDLTRAQMLALAASCAPYRG